MAGSLVWAQEAAPTITLSASQRSLAEVVRMVADRAGLRVEIEGTLPDETVTIELREATLEGALERLLGPWGWRYELQEGLVKLSPVPDVPPPTPVVEGLPRSQFIAGRALLYAVFRQPRDQAAKQSLGDWLVALRPDWQVAFRGQLPALWMAWGSRPAQLLRGAVLFEELGELDAARVLLPLVRRDPELEAESRCRLATLELTRGNAARAYAEATLVLRKEPGNGWAAALSAQANRALGRQQEALAEAMSAAARWPDSAVVQAALGNLLRTEPASAGAAARALQRALDLSPGLPDALFGLGVLAASEDWDAAARWSAMLAAEPDSVRAGRIRMGLVTLRQQALTERGGPVGSVTSDGERLLYYMKYRKQLEITDTRGTGLANQLTDQDTDKAFASLSPDEQWLAWVVPTGDRQRLYLQGVNASGHEKEIAQAERGGQLGRTTWSPDGRYLVFSEQIDRDGARRVTLRAWDMTTQTEVSPPAPLDAVDGLGDVIWRPDGHVIGTVLRDGRLAVVEVEPDGTVSMLRPPARLTAYQGPSLDPAGLRLVYQNGELVGGLPDGSEAGEVAVLPDSRTTGTGLWAGQGERLVVALADNDPAALTMGGQTSLLRIRCRPEPWPTTPNVAPVYTFALSNPGSDALTGTLTAAVVDDEGAEPWRTETPLRLAADGTATVVLRPETAALPAWLRVDLVVNGMAERPRWYRFGGR